MKCSIISAFVALVSLGQAFDIPEAAPDGTYMVAMDAEGNALSEPTLIAAPVSAKRSRSFGAQLDARSLPNPQAGCEGHWMNNNDYYSVVTSFKDACQGNTVPPNWAYYAKYGSAVVYMCNYGGNNPCNAGEFQDSMNLLNSNCASVGAGWVLIQTWKKGYGRQNTGGQICSWHQNV
ncbi:hypothetical protein DL95DRAFT_523777 [Leptodontidium sp. 2 PMI_412]|nr:hypothetical protein BKA61DRAFT_657813 [Leptodontidium sp. MPI-SDFR-AT-0119]KAH9214658.1 hypothetical protein DL95DRAFT_523777 [Leptodontidium sp. 2 PMI_412]